MNIHRLRALDPGPPDGPPRKVLHESAKFKALLIMLPPGGVIPPCEMSSHVIFTVIEGAVEVTVNGDPVALTDGDCLITEPATLSMRSAGGARVMGTQIH
ncbi:MAG: cupin domain-containing protein [Bacillota bacterium]|nr:cupin domain-containing protein [Bacillota bacterium]